MTAFSAFCGIELRGQVNQSVGMTAFLALVDHDVQELPYRGQLVARLSFAESHEVVLPTLERHELAVVVPVNSVEASRSDDLEYVKWLAWNRARKPFSFASRALWS